MNSRPYMTSLAAAALVALGAVGALQAKGHFWEARAQSALPPTAQSASQPPAIQAVPNFAAIVEANKGSVVNITVSGVEKAAAASPTPDFGQDDPFSQFFRRFQVPAPEQRKRGLGSGFVVGADGL